MTKTRKYEITHPWLTFKLDLGQFDYDLWLALGEAASKCEHIASVPLTQGVRHLLHQVYLSKGLAGTTAIEGNTLTEEQVQQRIEGKLKLPPSTEYLGEEIDNVLKGINLICDDLLSGGDAKLNKKKIKEYNRLALDGLELEKNVIPGEIRTYGVGVPVYNYDGAAAEDCDYLLQRLCDWLNEEKIWVPKAGKIVTGILKAIAAHIYIAWIHPFGDGNGRTARLVEFQLLVGAGVPSPVAHLLSNHYNHTRPRYYQELDKASKSGGDIVPFIRYAVGGLVDGLKEQLDYIDAQQRIIAWRDLVQEKFSDRNNKVANRLCYLALDLLPHHQAPLPAKAISSLSPRIMEAYQGLNPVSLYIDLKKLVELEILEKTPKGYRAKLEIIAGFLPERLASEGETEEG